MKIFSCFVISYFLSTSAFGTTADTGKLLHNQAPKTFQAVFQTSHGEFVVEAYRNWSPQGVNRFYQLVSSGFYNNTIIYRSTEKYVQFGINNDSTLNSFWERYFLKDEKVKFNNTGGQLLLDPEDLIQELPKFS